MDEFAVTFDPPIRPARRQHQIKPNLANFHAAAEAGRVPDLDPSFKVAGRTFGYYPAHASTVLSDLLGIADAISNRSARSIELCGYTVLLVDFREDRMFFYDPAGSYPNGGAPIGGGYDPAEVESAVRRAADAVWELVFPKG